MDGDEAQGERGVPLHGGVAPRQLLRPPHADPVRAAPHTQRRPPAPALVVPGEAGARRPAVRPATGDAQRQHVSASPEPQRRV